VSSDPLIQAITPPTDWYVVLRPFDGDHRYVRGEVVNTEGWTQIARLQDQRYIAPLPHGADLPEVDPDGRRIVDLTQEQEKIVPQRKRPVPTRKVKETV
jgi:hypothetical protein